MAGRLGQTFPQDRWGGRANVMPGTDSTAISPESALFCWPCWADTRRNRKGPFTEPLIFSHLGD